MASSISITRHNCVSSLKSTFNAPASDLKSHNPHGPMVCISDVCALVRLLHELLLPWFAVRNAARCNDHGTLDWSWRYFAPPVPCSEQAPVHAAYGVQQATAVHMQRSEQRQKKRLHA